MFQKVMAPIHDGLENTGFTQPSGLTQVSYCLDCGGEATTACQSDPRGSLVAGVTHHDIPGYGCLPRTGRKSTVFQKVMAPTA